MKKLIVIGGGASGMTAAITAARNGCQVTILEHNPAVGKKILSTGNGRCNLTNEHMDPSCFRSDTPEIIAAVLEKFGSDDVIRFFRSLGLMTKSKNGYIYPRSEQAAAVRTLLEAELRRLNISVFTDTHVSAISKEKIFRVTVSDREFSSDALILAAGSRASKGLGADGSGYKLAESMGHSLSPIVPALVQLKSDEKWFKKVAGVRTDASVTAVIDGNCVSEDTGELQITDYGLSGIPIFQISRYITKALSRDQKAHVEINFLPHMDRQEMTAFLLEQKADAPGKSADEMMSGIFNKKLCPILLSRVGIRENAVLSSLPDEKLSELVEACMKFIVPISGSNSFDHAQVCAGGVNTSEVYADTMESRLIKDLYITGELLDVDGVCGGYNLYFSFASGYLAGSHVSERGSV